MTSLYFLSRLVFVLLISLLIIDSAEAQLKKGDYHVDFRNLIFYSSQGINRPAFNVDITYLKMVSDRFMVGGGLFFERYHYRTSFRDISWTELQVRQISRYYFATGRVAPFASLENLFESRKLEGRSRHFLGYQLNPGLGLTYFLRPDIALEGLLTTNVLNMGDFDSVRKVLNFNLGLKLFFSNKFFTKTAALPERILKKGNIITTTRLNFRKELEDEKDGNLTIAPNIRYFLTDRLNIFAGYARPRSNVPSRYERSNLFDDLVFSLGAAYYIPLTDQLFWNFDINNSVIFSGDNLLNIMNEGIYFMATQISSSLQYFTGPAKFYGGISYLNISDRNSRDDPFRKIGSNYSLFTGVDYYISDYIFVNTELEFSDFNASNERNSGEVIRLDFGLGFIIGKKR